MSGQILYSTNVFLKFHIQQQYRGDMHYVWCSENFDSRTLGAYSSGALIPPSSNPADIYRSLLDDVKRGDRHSAKIAAQRASFKSLAAIWLAAGEITTDQKDEIIYMTEHADMSYWRPLLYIIPRIPVEPRLKTVPMDKRAGLAPEYIIEDLRRSEFDLIEL
jgi:hypothetical protein